MVNNIVENIAPRNDILVTNNYSIFNDKMKDEFHLVIYYINPKKAQIIIRRMDSENGWGIDLKIKIYDEKNNSHQIISIGSCEENYKIIELYTKITLVRKDSIMQKIPKVIMQTNNILIKNIKHYNAICTLLEHNPSYEYVFFDDSRCIQFLREHYKVNILLKNQDNGEEEVDVVKAFQSIIPGAIKADFFRYCYLYIHGGVYIDHKVLSNISLDELIHPNDELILCKDDAPNSYYNGIIMCTKNNIQLYEIIKSCMNHIFENKYLNDIHEPTGNKLFYQHFSKHEAKLMKNNEFIRLNNGQPLNVKNKNKDNSPVLFVSHYKNYYQDNYSNFRDEWSKKSFYYKNVVRTSSHYFYFAPSKFQDTFTVMQLKENIFILKRTDSNLGWTLDIHVDSIHISSGQKKTIHVGSSNENEKVFIIE